MKRHRRGRFVTSVNEVLAPDGLELRPVRNDDEETIAFDVYDVGAPGLGGPGRGKVGRLSTAFARHLAHMRPEMMALAIDTNTVRPSYAQRAAMGRKGGRR